MKRKVAFGVMMVFIGLISLWQAVGVNVWDYIKQHSERTSNNAYTLDKTLDEIIREYSEKLTQLAGNDMFQHVQERWKETGEDESVAVYLEEFLIPQDKMIDDFLIVENENIIYSNKDDYRYKIEQVSDDSSIGFCTVEMQLKDLAIIHEAKSNVKYIILIDLKNLQSNLMDKKIHMPEDVYLIDRDNHFMIHTCRGELFVGTIEEGKRKTLEAECIDTLVKGSKGKESKIHIYEHHDLRIQETHNDYVFCLPAQLSENKVFTIGVSVAFSDTINSIRKMAFKVLCSTIVIMIGGLFLIREFVKVWKDSKKRRQEIEQIQVKHLEKEKQHLEIQELAHRQRLETIGVLTAGIAHEFNNLLTPIMGYSMLTIEQLSEEEEEIYDNVLQIYNASKKAKDIVTRLSSMSRKDDTFTYSQISIDSIIEKVLNMMKSTQPKGIVVEMELDCKEQMIWANETLIMQMIMNLVLNVFQVMRDDGGILTISTGIKNRIINLTVKDTGIGIPKDILEKIFDPFFTTKQSANGTGLGLAIVKQVVDAHNGTIEVQSVEGEGTTFIISLPINDVEAITQ